MEPMNADAGHYGVQLAAEVLALRDSVEVGSPPGGRTRGRRLGRWNLPSRRPFPSPFR